MKKAWNRKINRAWTEWIIPRPTREWIEGWTAFMQEYARENFYKTGTPEYYIWQSGYDAAKRENS